MKLFTGLQVRYSSTLFVKLTRTEFLRLKEAFYEP